MNQEFWSLKVLDRVCCVFSFGCNSFLLMIMLRAYHNTQNTFRIHSFCRQTCLLRKKVHFRGLKYMAVAILAIRRDKTNSCQLPTPLDSPRHKSLSFFLFSLVHDCSAHVLRTQFKMWEFFQAKFSPQGKFQNLTRIAASPIREHNPGNNFMRSREQS